MMYCLTVHVPQAVAGQAEIDAAVQAAKALGRYPEHDVDDKTGDLYLNFFTEMPDALKADILSVLNADNTEGEFLRQHGKIYFANAEDWDNAEQLYPEQ